MDRVAGSFAFPFRTGARRAWLVGIPLVLLLPLGAVPLLGYAVAVVRRAEADPEAGLPPWRPLPRLLAEGSWVAIALLVLTAPFILLAVILTGLLGRLTDGLLAAPLPDPSLRGAVSAVLGVAVTALPWGILLLVLMPPATARFARSGSPLDLVSFRRSVNAIRRGFGAWNLAVVAIVTAWAIGICGLGLALVGVVPGIFYAILVSAHATASLADG